MNLRFEGKVVLVTGGNSGIGLAAAKAYAREGASVVITGRDEKTLAQSAKDIGEGAFAIKSDAGKISDIENVIAKIREKFGRIDAMVLNAGVGKFVPLEQVTESFYEDTFNVNVKGIVFMIQKALPLMKPGTAVVLIASINGHMAMPNSSVYGATKAAVISLARNLSLELVDRGIRINSISPGPVDTAILSRNLSSAELKQTKDWITSQVPMKRFARPEEIAAAILYLTSPESAYVIGEDLVIDGGMHTLS